MIKEKLKKTAALMLSAAMVLGLAPSMAGGMKTYADDDIEKWAGEIGEHFYVDSSSETYGLFKSAVPTNDNCGSDSDDGWTPKEISGDEGVDFSLVDRYNASFLNVAIGYDQSGQTVYAPQEDTIGAVIYSSDNTVMAAKGMYSDYLYDEVYLVIQGHQYKKNKATATESDSEYYYRIRIDKVRLATNDYIIVPLDKNEGYDVSKCRIWLEGKCKLQGYEGTFWATKAEQHDHKSEGKRYLCYKGGDGKDYHAHFCDVNLDENTGTIGCPFYNYTFKDIGEHTTKYIDLNDLDENTKEILVENGYKDCHFEQCTVCGFLAPYTDVTTSYAHEYKYSHNDDKHWEVCKDCGYIKPSTSEEQTHSPSDAYVDDDPTHHWKNCKICYVDGAEDNVKLDYAPHNFNEEGICKDCGYGEKGETEDTFTYIKEKEATCVDEGNEEYWEYTAGGSTTYYQAIGETVNVLGISGIRQLEIVPNKPIKPIDPDNHKDQNNDYEDYDVEYVSINSSNHKLVCSGCGEKLSEAPHNFDGNVCTDCGYRKSSGGSSNTNTGWIKDSKGWKYRNSDGIIAQGTTVTDADGNKVEKVLWQKAGNGYYAFGSDGYLVTGWIYDKLEDKWYYCDENMGKLYGWFNESQDGYWYYLSPSTGEALTGWHSINGKDYYFAGTPSAPTYSFDASTGFWIYSNINGVRPFGSMYANTVTPDNYQVDANGAWIH